MSAKMLWEDTFKNIKYYTNVIRVCSIGHWAWIRDQIMETLKSRLRIDFISRLKRAH